jgi:hypothetical protein
MADFKTLNHGAVGRAINAMVEMATTPVRCLPWRQ